MARKQLDYKDLGALLKECCTRSKNCRGILEEGIFFPRKSVSLRPGVLAWKKKIIAQVDNRSFSKLQTS
jgi:hypothetical protein